MRIHLKADGQIQTILFDQQCLTISAPAPVLSDYVALVDKRATKMFSCQSGTSTAAPQVAGLVALIKSFKPDASYNEVLKLLLDNSDSFFNLITDPNPETRGMRIKKINVRKTIEALTRDLDNYGPSEIQRRCKWVESELGSTLADAYGSQVVIQNDSIMLYDLQTSQSQSIPSMTEKCKGPHVSLPAIWDKEILFECQKRSDGNTKIFKYTIGDSDIQEMAARITYRPLMNYWNGFVSYLGIPPSLIYYHGFSDSPSLPISIPTLPNLINEIRNVFGSMTLISQYDPFFNYGGLIIYDSANNGFRSMPNLKYKSNSLISSPHNNQAVIFDKDNFEFYLANLSDLTSRKITNLPPEHIYAQFQLPIQFFDGKLASLSPENRIYVWDVNTGARISILRLPPNTINPRYVLKGGKLTVQVTVPERSTNVIYSCDIK